MISISGELRVGYKVDGRLLTHFTLRSATIADSIAAVSKAPVIEGDGVQIQTQNNLTLRFYKAAEQMHFVDAPDMIVSGEMVLELADDDAEIILAAQDDVAKKRLAANSGLRPTTS